MFRRNVRILTFCRNYAFSTEYPARVSSCVSLIYFHRSSLPISYRETLYSFRTLASSFHPVGEGTVVRLHSRSLTRSTACVFGMVDFFNTSSTLSLYDTSGLFLRCYKRREACSFHFLGIVSNTMVSTSSASFPDLSLDTNFAKTLGLSIFK